MSNKEVMQPRANRIALVLFAIYLVLYGGFVFLSAFAPATMEVMPVAGVNLAILYGFGLIAVAFLLALLYGWLVVERTGPVTSALPPGGEAAKSSRPAAQDPIDRAAPIDDRS